MAIIKCRYKWENVENSFSPISEEISKSGQVVGEKRRILEKCVERVFLLHSEMIKTLNMM